MKKLLVVILLLNVLFVSACSNISSFDVTYQELLQKFSDNDFRFSETGVKSFDDNEKLIS